MLVTSSKVGNEVGWVEGGGRGKESDGVREKGEKEREREGWGISFDAFEFSSLQQLGTVLSDP